VEIGIACGGSLFMWRDYFKGKARVIGIDFNPDETRWKKHGFEIFIGNQSDPNFWDSFFNEIGKIDILIDDGGHTNEQQIQTFINCYKHINDNGIMVFEDTHASYLKEFGNPSKYSFINFCKLLVDKQNIKSLKNFISFNYVDRIFKVEFYQSLVVMHFDKDKAEKSDSISNNGIIINSEDYRLRDVKFFSILEKIKKTLRNFFGDKIYNLIKKIYPEFLYIIFKFKNLKNKRYFK